MIYQKRGRWKSTFSAASFATREEAEALDNKERGYVPPPTPEPVEEPAEEWSPLEKLRGWKTCEECNCDPCECEWKSVEETLSETESSTEDLS